MAMAITIVSTNSNRYQMKIFALDYKYYITDVCENKRESERASDEENRNENAPCLLTATIN